MSQEFVARNGIISKSNLIVSGSLTALSTITAQTLVVQTITSSISSITGSTNFGSLAANIHTFTGSILTSGSIGIGTIPLTILDVKQTATGSTTVNSAFRDSSTNGNALQIWNGNNEARLRAIYYGTPSDQNITFYTITSAGSEAERMRITYDGKVGIGTPTPSAPLEISYNNTSFSSNPILSLNNTSITGQTHINFLITGSVVGKIRSDYEGSMIYVTNNRGNERAHYFLVNGDVNTGSVVLAIKANGKVGVGSQSPSSTLGVTSTGADGLIMEPDLSNTQNSSRLFFTGSVQTFALFNNAGDLRLTHGAQAGNTSGTSFVRFTNTGKYFRMEGSTGGIQFGGDTAAANALNDYEEGTWTPTIAGGGGDPTYVAGNRSGWYTKVGRVVTITWFISFFKNTLSGTLRLTNFPFSLLNGPLFYPQGTVLLDTLGTTTNNITMQGANNSSSGDFIGGNGTTSTHTGLSVGVLGAGEMQCRGTLTYFTA
jgi:hypothetical protein